MRLSLGLLSLALVAGFSSPSFAGKKNKKKAAAAAKKAGKSKGAKAGAKDPAPKGYNPAKLVAHLDANDYGELDLLAAHARSAKPDKDVWVDAADRSAAEAALAERIEEDVAVIEYVRVRKLAGVSLWVERGEWGPDSAESSAHYAFDDQGRLRYYRESHYSTDDHCGPIAATVTIRIRPDGNESRTFRHTLNGNADFSEARVQAGCEKRRLEVRGMADPGYKPIYTVPADLPRPVRPE